MSDPIDPNQPGAYGAYPYEPQPPTPARPGLSTRLGPRARRRPEARFSTSIAGTGAALVLAGVLVWSFGYLAAGLHLHFDSGTGISSTSGEGRRFVGVVLSALLVLVGYSLVIVRRTGPLATAGIVAGAFSVPILLTFLTLDLTNLFRGELPFSIDAVYLVSIVAWLASYLLIPGAAGRAFLLALALNDIASYIAFKSEGNDIFVRATVTIQGGGSAGSTSGAGTLAAIGLIFGLGYYAIAAVLDRGGRAGVAVAFVVAGFSMTLTGVIAAVPSFHQVGTGILLVVVGGGLCWYAGWFGRRFTAWFWAFGFLVGVGLLVEKAIPHSYTGAGITLIVVGAVIVALAQAISAASNEPPEFAAEPMSYPAAPGPNAG